jgi:hypothetical protein
LFDETGDFLIRAGNDTRQGAEFVRPHYFLSLIIANLHGHGHFEQNEMALPAIDDALTVADRLVLTVITWANRK